MLDQARARGGGEGLELLLREVEGLFSAVVEVGSAPDIRRVGNALQSVLLAAQFDDGEAADQAVTELEQLACDVFTSTDLYSDKILTTRVLVFCYLYLNHYFGDDPSAVDIGNAVEHICAMFETLCESPEVVDALHYELAKKTFSSLPGGRKARQVLLKDIADIRQDVQTLTGYLLDIKDAKGKNVNLYDMKAYKMVVHIDTIHQLLVYRGRLYSASADGTIKVFDAFTLIEQGCLISHKKSVLCMAAIDGRLYSGSCDKTIRIWDVATNKECKVSFRKHQNDVTSLVVIDRKLYSGSADSTILVWDVGDAPLRDVPTGILRGHRDSILTLLPMPSCRRLVSGSLDSMIKVWDLESMSELFSFVNSGVRASVMVVSPSEDILFTNSWDNTLKVWYFNDVSRTPVMVRGHTAQVTALAVSCGRLFSGDADGKCKVWAIDTMLELSSHSGHSGEVTSIATDGGTFFSAATDKSISRHFSGVEELVLGEA